MDKKILPFTLAVAFLLTLSYAIEVVKDVQPNENWQTETVDDSGWVGIDSSITVDSNDNPHISHYDQGNKDLKYAHWNGSEWKNEVVDSDGDVGEESGITLDDSGNVHISYVDATNGYLKHANKTGGSWSIEIVDQSEGYFTMATSIALDNNDYPHIGYSMRPSGEGPSITKYSYWDGDSWNTETVTAGTDAYFALDLNDTPHLCFKKEDNSGIERINYAKRTEEGWSVEVVDPSTSADGDCGIAADSKGYAHIAYNDYGNNAKGYANWNGTSWDIETVASDVGSAEGTKIAVDSLDRPHIVYIDENNEALKYTLLNGSSWVTEIIDKMGNPSITLDSSDSPHVSHGYTVGESIEDETEILKYSVRYITTTTVPGECDLVGDNPPCGEVIASEVTDLINQWAAENAGLSDVIALINAWASP